MLIISPALSPSVLTTLMLVSPPFAATASVVASKGVVLVTLMLLVGAFAAAASVVPRLEVLATLMFVSPAFAAAARVVLRTALLTGLQVMLTSPVVLSVATDSVDRSPLKVQGESCKSSKVGWAHFRAPPASMPFANVPVGQAWLEVAKFAPL